MYLFPNDQRRWYYFHNGFCLPPRNSARLAAQESISIAVYELNRQQELVGLGDLYRTPVGLGDLYRTPVGLGLLQAGTPNIDQTSDRLYIEGNSTSSYELMLRNL